MNQRKLYIMRGLPASGKTYKASKIMEEEGDTIRLSRGELDRMLHLNVRSAITSSLTADALTILIRHYISRGHNVIVDDENLNFMEIATLKAVAKSCDATVEIIEGDGFDDCLSRLQMTMQNTRIPSLVNSALEFNLFPKDKQSKGFVICDLDGTLVDSSHRKDKGFECIPEDRINEKVLKRIREYSKKGHDVIILSERPESTRRATEEWMARMQLFKAFSIISLIMKKDSDRRDEVTWKNAMLKKYFKDASRVHKVIDNNKKVKI